MVPGHNPAHSIIRHQHFTLSVQVSQVRKISFNNFIAETDLIIYDYLISNGWQGQNQRTNQDKVEDQTAFLVKIFLFYFPLFDWLVFG